MKKLTASSVASALRCAYPYRPGVRTVPRPSGPAALMGTDVHTAIELALAGKTMVWGDQPHAQDAARHAVQAVSWIKSFGAPTHVEQGFVYDGRNDLATWGPRRGEPGYNDTPSHAIRGTLDLAWVANDVAYLADIKTGKTQNAHVEQLLMQALAVSRVTGVKVVRVGFLFTRLTKVLPPEWQELDEDALDAFAGRLHRLSRTLPMAQATPNEGCKWCEVPPDECPAFLEEKVA